MEISRGTMHQLTLPQAQPGTRPLEQVPPAGAIRDERQRTPPSWPTREAEVRDKEGAVEPGREVTTGPVRRRTPDQGGRRGAPPGSEPPSPGPRQAARTPAMAQLVRSELIRSRLFRAGSSGREQEKGQVQQASIPPWNRAGQPQALRERYRIEVPGIDMDLTA